MDNEQMTAYRVGSLFQQGVTRWPEGPHLWLGEDMGGIMLGLFLTKPDPREVAAIGAGPPRFAWTVHGSLGFLLFKFGDSPWNDAPFTPHRLTEPFDLHPYERGTHRRVSMFLVHADTGIIAAMRLFSWPAYFYNTVVATARQLETQPYAQDEAAAHQQEFYRSYPDGPSLYRLARSLPAESRCNGGQRDDRPIP